MDDLISRKAAIDCVTVGAKPTTIRGRIAELPSAQPEVLACGEGELSAQPEIIYCKDCVKHNKGHEYYLDGTCIGIKDCCPLVEIRGIAQGHEFDYQYCAYAERRTDERSD